jgi:4-hydroxythreonine-4-phosphate dehydrogenase
MNFVNVTQGHEDSIGLEVFIKSFLSLDLESQKKVNLFTYKNTLEKNLKLMRLDYQIDNDYIQIANTTLKLSLLNKVSSKSESFNSLIEAEKSTKEGDVLVTLPTTKNSLIDGNFKYTGHTDYFRKKYVDRSPVMLFKSENFFMALLSEHIPLEEVEGSITKELIKNKLKVLASNPYFKFKEFVFSGVNPHCGEDGLIGFADGLLDDAIKSLKLSLSPIVLKGPISGDTIFLDCRDSDLETCIICSQHDQGLAPFKALSGLQAVNITLGLPFLRLSPDHGTAFNLYGKDKANYLGTLYTLKLALESVGLE